MIRYRVFPRWLGCLIAVILIVVGCGKKDDPIPPQVKLPTVTDLVTVSTPEGVVMNWTMAVQIADIGRFKILRSVTGRGNEACPGCPQEYRPYREAALAEARLHREGINNFRYVDTDVRNGSFYSYRIAICNRTGYCGEASNEAGVIHTGR